MRTLMKVKIPTAQGNEAIKDGSLPEIIGKALAGLNDIPAAAEPFFMAFDAQISFAPVMNADDMRAGIGKAMEAA
jgi:hypothetical protein